MIPRTTPRHLPFACLLLAVLMLGLVQPAFAKKSKTSPLNVSTPQAGVVDHGKIPVRAKLDVKRSLKVKRARFYVGNKLVTTDRRHPFKVKKGVRFDTTRLIGGRGILRLSVRYEYKSKRGKLVRRTLVKRISLTSDGVTGLGTPDAPQCTPTMLFCDDFGGDSLDASKWNSQRRTGPETGAGNFPWFAWNAGLEGAHYSPDNVRVGDGVLTLFVTDVPSGQVPDSNYEGHLRPKTTGSINTDGKFAFQYGTMEARIKFDRCGACWQSFWLHRAEYDPDNNRPEFDIFESMPWAPGVAPYTVLHGLVGESADEHGVQRGKELRLAGEEADLSDGWHTYRITRSSTHLAVSIDDDPAWSWSTDDPNYVTDTQMFAILSMAIINPIKTAELGLPPIELAPAGSKMQVDYLRAWPLGS